MAARRVYRAAPPSHLVAPGRSIGVAAISLPFPVRPVCSD